MTKNEILQMLDHFNQYKSPRQARTLIEYYGDHFRDDVPSGAAAEDVVMGILRDWDTLCAKAAGPHDQPNEKG